MDWKEEPATQQQLLRLQEYGFVPTCPLTVTQAARLIRQHSKHSRPAVPPTEKTLDVVTQHRPVESTVALSITRSRRLTETARMHAYQLRLTVRAAERSVA